MAPFKIPDMSAFDELWAIHAPAHANSDSLAAAELFYRMGLENASVTAQVDPSAAAYLVCRNGKTLIHWNGLTSMPEGAVWPVYSSISAAEIREINEAIEPQSDKNDDLAIENAALRMKIAEYEAQLGVFNGVSPEEQKTLDDAALEAERYSFEVWACTSPDAYWFMRTYEPEKLKTRRNRAGYKFPGIGESATGLFNAQYMAWMARSAHTNRRVQKALIDRTIEMAFYDAQAGQGEEDPQLGWTGERYGLLKAFGNVIHNQQLLIQSLYAAIPDDLKETFKLPTESVLDYALREGTAIELKDHEKEYGPSCAESYARYSACSRCNGFEAVMGLKWQLYCTQRALIALTACDLVDPEVKKHLDELLPYDRPLWFAWEAPRPGGEPINPYSAQSAIPA